VTPAAMSPKRTHSNLRLSWGRNLGIKKGKARGGVGRTLQKHITIFCYSYDLT
jgi:hypothetical protein